jgi:orotidine-5'-phosphate decarboxylase
MALNFQNPKDRLVLALDVDTQEEAIALVKELKDYVGIYKVGLQLLTRQGPEIVKAIQEEGCKIFFDAKFHDIPNTVSKASQNAVKLGVNIFDVHVTGGSKMMKAAAETVRQTAIELDIPKPLLLGITILSSLDQSFLTDEIQIDFQLDEYAMRLAKLAKRNELDGVVASVKEVAKIKQACGKEFVVLCPGIRPAWAAKNDQSRIATPQEAIKQGADLMVVGRPITAAENRVEAARKILEEIESALG